MKLIAIFTSITLASCNILTTKEEIKNDTILVDSIVKNDTIKKDAIDTVAAIKLIDSLKVK